MYFVSNQLINYSTNYKHASIHAYRGATTSSKLGVRFLDQGYHYRSTEKIDRSTQFGAVGYIITLYS